jgi:hypothetical protein
MILEMAVGRAQMGRHGVGWEGATTHRASARKEEQRTQHAPWRLSWIRSAFTERGSDFLARQIRIHGHLQQEKSGQLPSLG